MNFRRFLFDGEIMKLMGITMLVKPLGLITQVLIAKYFGASAMLDAYTLLLFLVTFLGFTLSGVYSSVVIPQMTRIKAERSEREVAGYQNAVTLLFFLPVTFLVLAFLVRGEVFIDLVGANLPPVTKDYCYRVWKILAVPFVCFLFCENQFVLVEPQQEVQTTSRHAPVAFRFFLRGGCVSCRTHRDLGPADCLGHFSRPASLDPWRSGNALQGDRVGQTKLFPGRFEGSLGVVLDRVDGPIHAHDQHLRG